jgi:hypothetical protein
VDGEPLARSLCHCRSCRLASGAPSVAWAVLRSRDVTWLRGQPATYPSSPGVLRSFCPNCGTPLSYQRVSEPETLDITTATLDQPERFPPDREIWLEHRIAWATLNESISHYPRSSRAE